MREAAARYAREIGPGRYKAEYPLVVNLKDGSVLAQVPAGTFEMGDGKDSDCPKHRVELSAYWIGVHPVTNRQYARFVAATGHRAPETADYGDAVWSKLGRRGGLCEVGGVRPADRGAMGEGGAGATEPGLSLGERVGRGQVQEQP